MKPNLLKLAGSGVVIVLVDQISRSWAANHLNIREGHSVLGQGFLEIARYSCVRSMGHTARYLPWVAFFLLFITACIRFVSKPSRAETWGLTLMLSGGISNLSGRLYENAVVAVLRIHVGDSEYLPFSLADISVMAGAILLSVVYGRRWLNEGMLFAE